MLDWVGLGLGWVGVGVWVVGWGCIRSRHQEGAAIPKPRVCEGVRKDCPPLYDYIDYE